jgi:hypothetical protein
MYRDVVDEGDHLDERGLHGVDVGLAEEDVVLADAAPALPHAGDHVELEEDVDDGFFGGTGQRDAHELIEQVLVQVIGPKDQEGRRRLLLLEVPNEQSVPGGVVDLLDDVEVVPAIVLDYEEQGFHEHDSSISQWLFYLRLI